MINIKMPILALNYTFCGQNRINILSQLGMIKEQITTQPSLYVSAVNMYTLFPHIVIFWIWKLEPIQVIATIFLFFYFINWIFAAETIQGWRLYEEIGYIPIDLCII